VIGFSSSEWAQVIDQDTGDIIRKGFWDIGGSGWYRIAMPAMALQAQGYDVAMGELCQRGGYLGVKPFDEKDPVFPEVIVMQRFMQREVADAIPVARSLGQVVVQDVDDFFHGLHERNRAASVVNPSDLDHYARSIAESDLVTVSTPYLAKRYRHLNERMVVVPNAIDLARWSAQPPPSKDAVGWVGATPWRSRDLETLQRVLPPWLKRNGYGFFHGGFMPSTPKVTVETAWDQLGVDTSQTRVTYAHACSVDRYPRLFDGFNFGIVPLSDVPFNRAKSAIKGIEYAASGRPFIAQAMPAYVELHQRYGLGFLARSWQEWAKALDHLRENWAEESLRHRVLVAPLDIATRWVDWADAYQLVAAVAP